ncbi:hypothetical protein BaRGS_00024208, partial [Batillaria attramentaria]
RGNDRMLALAYCPQVFGRVPTGLHSLPAHWLPAFVASLEGSNKLCKSHFQQRLPETTSGRTKGPDWVLATLPTTEL